MKPVKHKNRMRILFALAFVAALFLALNSFACGSKSSGDDDNNGTSTSTTDRTDTATTGGTSTGTSSGTGTSTETVYSPSTVTGYPGVTEDIKSYGDNYLVGSPSAVYTGNSFEVDAYITNGGGGFPDPFKVHFYLSANTIISPADHYLGEKHCNTVAPASPYHLTLNCNIPTGIPSGRYYVGMILDPYDNVAETNETNNVGCNTQDSVLVNPTGSTQSVTCYPADEEFSTGYVQSGTYAKTDGDLHVCFSSTSGMSTSGWIKFDLSTIPTDATITKVTFHYNVFNVTEGYDSLRFYILNFDPASADGTETYGAGVRIEPPQSVLVTGWIETEPESGPFCAAVQQGLAEGYCALRFCGF